MTAHTAAHSSSNTVAILAQGTSWAVAVTQAFCCGWHIRTYINIVTKKYPSVEGSLCPKQVFRRNNVSAWRGEVFIIWKFPMPGGFICCCALAPHHCCTRTLMYGTPSPFPMFIFKQIRSGRDYHLHESSNLCCSSADSSTNTVAILAQGTSWAVAVTQAFCCMVQMIHSGFRCISHLQPMFSSSQVYLT